MEKTSIVNKESGYSRLYDSDGNVKKESRVHNKISIDAKLERNCFFTLSNKPGEIVLHVNKDDME